MKKDSKKESVKNKKLVLLLLGILLAIALLICIFGDFSNDGMLQTKGIDISYRTFTKEKGWSKWVKNGVTSGNGINEIKKIQVEVKSNNNGKIDCNTYKEGKWTHSKIEKNVNGVRIALTDKLKRKYSVYYRTYNKSDKWLNWSSNGDINGNKNQSITKIEIKAVDKDATYEDYLKDYSMNNIRSKGFEKEGE